MADPNKLIDGAKQAVAIAARAGASGSFVHVSRSRSTTCTLRDGALEKVEESTDRGLSIELYVDGRYSSHQTNDLRADSLEGFIADAVALTRALEVDEFRALPDPARYAGAVTNLDLHDPALSSSSAEQRLERGRRLSAKLTGKEVISASATVYEAEGESGAVSSNGFEGAYRSTGTGYYASATLRDGDERRPEGGFGMSARHLEDLLEPEVIGDEALARARARLGAAKGPTTRTTMVVDRHAVGSMIWRLLSPAFGQSVQQGRSMWLDKLDQPVISPKLSLVSDPLIPRGLGSHPFDGEGVAAFRMPMIEGGALRHYLLDTYYARKLGVAPTTMSLGNLVVSPGKRGLEAIAKDVGEGVYVTSWLGGNADPTTGDFSFGLRGHLISGGAIAAPVGEMNVTGNLIALFARLAEVGGDPWNHGQVRAPTMVFEDVQFSGA